jgi:hypothetical protein
LIEAVMLSDLLHDFYLLFDHNPPEWRIIPRLHFSPFFLLPLPLSGKCFPKSPCLPPGKEQVCGTSRAGLWSLYVSHFAQAFLASLLS